MMAPLESEPEDAAGGEARYGYHPIPGSRELVTARRGGDAEVEALDRLDPAAVAGRRVHGEWLTRVVVRQGYAAVLKSVFDRLVPEQEPLEQALYLQLYRLSYGEERNWCRVSRKELERRTGLSDRRLGSALAGLAAKGHLRLVHRDRRGTLYRVLLPHEVFGEPIPDEVMTSREPGRPRPGAAPDAAEAASTPASATPVAPARASASVASRADEATPATRQAAPAASGPERDEAARPRRERRPQPEGSPAHRPGTKGYKNDTLLKSQTIGTLAADFVRRFGGPGRSKAEVLEEILGRLEEGRSLAEAAEELARFGRLAPGGMPIAHLARWLDER